MYGFDSVSYYWITYIKDKKDLLNNPFSFPDHVLSVLHLFYYTKFQIIQTLWFLIDSIVRKTSSLSSLVISIVTEIGGPFFQSLLRFCPGSVTYISSNFGWGLWSPLWIPDLRRLFPACLVDIQLFFLWVREWNWFPFVEK